MTALACFRIIIDTDRAVAGGEALAALVGKVASAFLESRWVWPRRYGEIAPFAFLLADPRLSRLEPAELINLSEELHLKLFGGDGAGRVRLAMLEGEQDAVTNFAAVDPAVLRKILAEGGVIPGVPGLISEISREGLRVVSPTWEAAPTRPVAAATPFSRPMQRREAPANDDGVEASFRAVWCFLKQTVIGSTLVARRKGARGFYSTVDSAADMPGAAAAEFDMTCLSAAPRALVGSRGLIFLPISFSSTIHRATRESYLDVLEALPQQDRPRLAATVYDVPRAPTFAAVRQLRAFLSPYFSFVDLQTADPDFQIDALMMEAVNSVTFSLPDTDDGGRFAAATRFMTNRDAYQRRRVWPATTNVRTRRELEFCVKLRVPFLSGKAISDHLVAPVEPARCLTDQLPLREASIERLTVRI